MDDLPPYENAHTDRLALQTMHGTGHGSFTKLANGRNPANEGGGILAGRV